MAVEGTAALGPYWQTILSDYLDKIIRSVPRTRDPSFSSRFLEVRSLFLDSVMGFDCIIVCGVSLLV